MRAPVARVPPTHFRGNLLLRQHLRRGDRYVDTSDPYDPLISRGGSPTNKKISPPRAISHTWFTSLENGCPRSRGRHLGRGRDRYSVSSDRIESCSAIHCSGWVRLLRWLTCACDQAPRTALVPTWNLRLEQPTEFIKPLIVKRANEASTMLGLSTKVAWADFRVEDRFDRAGLWPPSRKSLDVLVALAQVAKASCLIPLLWEVCRGACEACCGREVRLGQLRIFVHTGGGPGLFQHAPPIANYLKSGDVAPSGLSGLRWSPAFSELLPILGPACWPFSRMHRSGRAVWR